MPSMILRAANDNHTLLTKLYRQFRDAVTAEAGPDVDFATREAVGLALANELCRVDQQADLVRRSELLTAKRITVDGRLYERRGKPDEVPVMDYHGLCGKLPVPRALYREVGVRNGPHIAPLEVEAGLMMRATPALADKLAEAFARNGSRVVAEGLLSAHRVGPSRSTIERIAKGLAASMAQQLETIEPEVRRLEELPVGAHGISVGLDRTTVPMEEPAPDKPPVVRKKPRVRKAPEPVEVLYRMAYVASFTIVDADGRALVTRRYGVPADAEPAEMLERLGADVTRALEQRPDLPVGLVQDGAVEMWNLMRDCLGVVLEPGSWSEAIDRHHLLERLGDALRHAGLNKPWRAQQLTRWNTALDEDALAIDTIEAYIISLRDGLQGDARRRLSEHVTYLENNKDRMRYAPIRAAGLPVGSGATEGACKSLVMTRAKACGQRWHDDGIHAVLLLRGQLLSDRLPAAMRLLRRQHAAAIKLAA